MSIFSPIRLEYIVRYIYPTTNILTRFPRSDIAFFIIYSMAIW